jgi:hypothetical protein
MWTCVNNPLKTTFQTSDLYYKHITIVNHDSRVVILMTLNSRMTLQAVASPTTVILMAPEISFTLLENMYSTCINRDDCSIFIVQVTASYFKDRFKNSFSKKAARWTA